MNRKLKTFSYKTCWWVILIADYSLFLVVYSKLPKIKVSRLFKMATVSTACWQIVLLKRCVGLTRVPHLERKWHKRTSFCFLTHLRSTQVLIIERDLGRVKSLTESSVSSARQCKAETSKIKDCGIFTGLFCWTSYGIAESRRRALKRLKLHSSVIHLVDVDNWRLVSSG